MSFFLPIITGALLAGLVALAAYFFKLLTPGGAIAAFILGTLVFGLGGLAWALILVVFFVTSSGLSYLFKKQKVQAEKRYAKGGRRDWGQVLANGGVAGFFVLLHVFFPDSVPVWIAFCSAFAAANADTWATELGVLNKKAPILISTGKSVEPGTSGAVSMAGTLAAAGGSLLIGLFSFWLWPKELALSWRMDAVGLIAAAGILGSLVDSLIGAKWQAIYFCPECQKETEKFPQHGCGTQTLLIRGIKWVNNDVVNVLCTFSGALLALLGGCLFLWG